MSSSDTGTHIGILHPGEMGVSIARSAQKSGNRVYWLAAGRSTKTRARAEQQQLIEVPSLAQLCEHCAILVSVCPPHSATAMAQEIAAMQFKGIYVDANAIAPQRVLQIGEIMLAAGAEFVDGGIIGPPAWEPDTTSLYLAGKKASQVLDCFAAGPLRAVVVGDIVGKASALKMCYAAYSKGSTALLAGVLAVAQAMGVRSELQEQWARSASDPSAETGIQVQKVTAKAWRFAGEMEEIAATFKQAGAPEEFHLAAADLYGRIAGYKDASVLPELEDILSRIVNPDANNLP